MPSSAFRSRTTSLPPAAPLLHWESRNVPRPRHGPACHGGSQQTCLAWRPLHPTSGSHRTCLPLPARSDLTDRESAHVPDAPQSQNGSQRTCLAAPRSQKRESAHVPDTPQSQNGSQSTCLSGFQQRSTPPDGSQGTCLRDIVRLGLTQVGVRERGSALAPLTVAWESEHVLLTLHRRLFTRQTGVRTRVLPRARAFVRLVGVITRAFPPPRCLRERPKVGVRERELGRWAPFREPAHVSRALWTHRVDLAPSERESAHVLSARPAAQVGVKARVFEPELHPRPHGVGVSARDFLLLHLPYAPTTAKAGVRTRLSRPQPPRAGRSRSSWPPNWESAHVPGGLRPLPYRHNGCQRTSFALGRTSKGPRRAPRPRPHAQSVRELGVRARAFGTPSAHACKIGSHCTWIGSHCTWIGSQDTWIGSQRTCLRPCGRCFLCPTLPPATRQRTTKPSSTITTPNQHVERKRRNQSQQGAKDDVAIPATPLERPRSRASQSAC